MCVISLVAVSLISLSLCVCLFVCLCVCVFIHKTQVQNEALEEVNEDLRHQRSELQLKITRMLREEHHGIHLN